MATKEATVRIKINKLLEAAGWRFFPEGNAPANNRDGWRRLVSRIGFADACNVFNCNALRCEKKVVEALSIN